MHNKFAGNDLILGRIPGRDRSLGLSREERNKHPYVCGGTGTGKSKFLENLIRQDIRNWSKSKCGMLVLDPHGSLYDNLINWLAWTELERPIIPIDLRQDEWVVAYNVVRQRQLANPSVLVDNLIAALERTIATAKTGVPLMHIDWNLQVFIKGDGLEKINTRLGKAIEHSVEPGCGRRCYGLATCPRHQSLSVNSRPSLSHRAHLLSGQGNHVLVKPDGFIRIHEKEKDGGVFEHTFFLEVDRSKEPQSTPVTRASCYRDYYRSGAFAVANRGTRSEYKQFPFRVLFVLRNAERRNNTVERLLDANPPVRTFVYLSTFGEVLADPLGKVWIRPFDYREALGYVVSSKHLRTPTPYRRQSAQEGLIEKSINKAYAFRR